MRIKRRLLRQGVLRKLVNGDKGGSKLQSGGLVADTGKKSYGKGTLTNRFSILSEVEDVVDANSKEVVHTKRDKKATAKTAEANNKPRRRRQY